MSLNNMQRMLIGLNLNEKDKLTPGSDTLIFFILLIWEMTTK